MRKNVTEFLKSLPTYTAKSSWLGLVLLISLTSLLCACSMNSKLLNDYVAPSLILPQGAPQKLAVVHGAPSGDLVLPEQYSTFTIVFNQPIVNLGARQVEIEGLSIEPPIKGAWAWRGTACLTFTPSEPLQVAHEYKVTVPAGLTAITGQKLAKPYTMRFVTPRPMVIHSSPADGSCNISLDKPVFLLFNQPINNQKALESLHLISSQSNGDIPSQVRLATEAEFSAYIKEVRNNEGDKVTMNGLSVDLDNLKAKQLVVLVPETKFKQGLRYTVNIPSGFKADSSDQHGSLVDQSFSFKTYEIFSLKSLTSSERNHPEDDIIFTFTNPVKMNYLAKALSFEPALEMPRQYLEADYSSNELNMNLPFQARTTYKIKISPDLKDEFGNTISASESINFTTSDFKPHLSLSSGQAVVEAKIKDAYVPFSSINIKSIRVEGRVLSIQDLVKMSKDDFFFGGVDNYTPEEGFTYQKDIVLEDKPNIYISSKIDLKPILGDKQKGLALLRITYQGQANKEEHKTLLVQLTDLCLTAKFSALGNLLWATSLDSGKPLANVKIALYNDKAESVFTGITDKQGLVKTPGWGSYAKAEDGIAPKQYMLASLGDDQAFICSSGSNCLETWKFNVFSYDTSYTEHIKSCLFTDKGVYSPGEELKFKALLRSTKQARLQLPKTVKTLNYEAKDGAGKTFAKGSCSVTPMGSLSGSVIIPQDVASGYAFMELTIPKKEAKKLGVASWLGSASYRIEDYQPVQTEAKVTSAQKSLLLGEEFKGRVEGRFLFGAPMDNDRFRYSASIDKKPYFSKKYPDYSFYSKVWRGDDYESTTLISGSGRLDNKGSFPIEIPTEGVKYESPSVLTVEASVISSSLKEVSGSLQVPVWPTSNIVGVKIDSYLVKQGQALQGQLLAVNKDEEAQKGIPIKIEIIRKSWDSVYKAGVSGAYNWVSDCKEELESTQTLISNQGPTAFNVTPKASGTYIIRASISDKNGRRSLNETEFWCSGSDYAAWERHDDNELDLKCNARTYLPGQTAEILVQSPFEEAEALVSVETDSVLDSWNVKLKGTAPTVQVPIKAFYAPNVYVSVILVKGREGKVNLSKDGLDLSKPTFKFGYTELKVDSPKSKLKVEVLSDFAQYKPGQTASVTVKLADEQGKPVSGEVCLWAVDEGVLNLVGYELPDYYKAFYTNRDLNVLTSESCADVMGLRSYGTKGANQGGGGGGNGDGVREDFAPTIMWKPTVTIDNTGHAIVRFKAPDSLTRYRIMAVACDQAERFGHGQASFEVSKKLVLLPSIIKYARSGDSFQVGVLARNNTEKTSSITVEAESKGLTLANNSFKTTLKPTEEKMMVFDASASVCGKFPIKFKGKLGTETDACQYTIEVIPDEKTNVAAVSGEFSSKEASEYIKIPGGVKAGSASLDISVSNNFSSQLNGAVQNLWEQDSLTLDTILARTEIILLTDRLGLKLPDNLNYEAKRKTAVGKYLKDMEKFFIPNGSFSLWPESKVSSNIYTAWALDLMTKLKNIDWLDKDKEYLYSSAKYYAKTTIYEQLLELDKVSDGNGDPGLPMLFAALCKTSEGQNSTLVVLYRNRYKFSLQGRAYILKAAAELNNQDIVSAMRREFNNSLKVEERQAWFEENGKSELRSSSDRVLSNTATLSAMLYSGDFRFASKVFAWLFSHKVNGRWGSELADAKVAEALTVYNDKEQVVRNDVKVKARCGGKQLLEGTLKYPQANCLFASNSIAAVGQKVPVEMSKTGSGKLYYDLLLRYAPTKPMPATDNGFYIFQSCAALENLDKPIPFTELKVGQVYKISINVISPVDRDQVIVNVPLPAGLEVVNTTFDTESNLYSSLLNKVNPDPNYGTFTNAEYYADHVKVWAEGLQAGEHTYSFLARAVACGHYRMPGARIYQKDHQEVFGCTSETRLKVVP